MPACASACGWGAETVEALDGSKVVARHARAVGKGAETLELDHYLEVLLVKPVALVSTPE